MALPGNDNAAKGTRWRDAIERAIEYWPQVCPTGQNDLMKGLNEAAHQFVAKMMDEGDLGFFKEFGDRLDGKPKQSVDVGGEVPFIQKITREVVDVQPKDTDPT